MELCKKVEENIRLNEEIYKLNIEIEEKQLRFLSVKKMEQNRYRYQAKKSK